jgi:hypothetical protein
LTCSHKRGRRIRTNDLHYPEALRDGGDGTPIIRDGIENFRFGVGKVKNTKRISLELK